MRIRQHQLVHYSSWRNAHPALVSAIMGEAAPLISIEGTGFSHQNNWTLRRFVKQIYQQYKTHPHLSKKEFFALVYKNVFENQTPIQPTIQIAQTPAQIPMALALAINGGVIHEALHGLWSCRRILTETEIHAFCHRVQIRAAQKIVPLALMLHLENLMEDIRIERLGCKHFPGIRNKLEELAEYIITEETINYLKNSARGRKLTELTCVMFCLREYGFEYMTPGIQNTLQEYRNIHPDAFDFVTEGPLSKIILNVRNLKEHQDTSAIQLTLDIFDTIFYQAGQSHPRWAPLCRRLIEEIKNPETCTLLSSVQVINQSLEQLLQGNPKHNNAKPLRRKQVLGDWRSLLQTAQKRSIQARTILRRLLLGNPTITRRDGVRQGRRLSTRYLIESALALRARQRPRRAFQYLEETPTASIAVSMLLDSSLSMEELLLHQIESAMLVASIIEGTGGVVEIKGFRFAEPTLETTQYIKKLERYQDFGTSIRQSAQELVWMEAKGGTLILHGLEEGVKGLQQRRETFRVLIAITDGILFSKLEKDGIQNTLARAAQKNIGVLLVNLGKPSPEIDEIFRNSLTITNPDQLAMGLVTNLTSLLRRQIIKRRIAARP